MTLIYFDYCALRLLFHSGCKQTAAILNTKCSFRIESGKNMTTEESNRWGLTETNALIEIWGDENVQNMFDGTIRDSEVYKLITKRFHDRGHKRSINQVKTKIKSLKKEYRKAKDALNTSGSGGKIKFVHFDMMNKFMSNKLYGQPLCARTSVEVIDFMPSCNTNSQSEFESILIKQEIQDVEEDQDIEADQDVEADPDFEADEATAETPSSTSEAPAVNKKLPPKRKRFSIKEFVKTAITNSVDKFVSLEKELEDRHLKQNKKFQEQLLQLEKEKINMLKLFLEK